MSVNLPGAQTRFWDGFEDRICFDENKNGRYLKKLTRKLIWTYLRRKELIINLVKLDRNEEVTSKLELHVSFIRSLILLYIQSSIPFKILTQDPVRFYGRSYPGFILTALQILVPLSTYIPCSNPNSHHISKKHTTLYWLRRREMEHTWNIS